MADARRKTVVLISGRGSNLAALIGAARDLDYPAEIALVVSDDPDAGGLDHAREAGVPFLIIDRKGYASKLEFEIALDDALHMAGADLVCLAGFMRLLSAEFVNAWRDRMLNIHPSLLPLFPGLNTRACAFRRHAPARSDGAFRPFRGG
jgi:phosphoribosylglycinamide formyltransferase-1